MFDEIDLEELARRTRRKAGVDAVAPLPTPPVAALLRLEVRSLTRHAQLSPEYREMLFLRDSCDGAFGAIAFPTKRGGLVVVNDGASLPRQRQAVGEEFAHVLLGHQAHPAFDYRGLRHFSAKDEVQAEQMAAALLVPAKATFAIVEAGLSIEAAAERYGVEPTWMVHRLKMTGAVDFPRLPSERWLATAC